MNERLKIMRKKLGLKQRELAEIIGVRENTISIWEGGSKTPSDRVVRDICREFNINEDWLRNGEGEMTIPKSKSEQITEFVADVTADDSSFKSRLVNALANLDQEQWDVLESMLDKLTTKK